ncbi:DUF4249 domain-containing protein [Hymenobacter sp. BT728]|nr:DUF4249 domain-containing protein [Hymenobacter pini]MCA8831455.1 DUF4249 domain-containing protein [Hymenobacter pini]
MLGLILSVSSCVEPYAPEVIQAANNYLVVEGSINSRGVTTIRLSRSVNLANTSAPPAESKAKVFIEQEAGGQYPLREGKVGTYTSADLTLAAGQRVRLHLTTAGGREYTSEFVSALVTPAIDSVTWKPTARGLQIAANAHDDANQTDFYRWDYEETWEFTTRYVSKVEYKNGKMVDRLEDINRCWTTQASTNVVLNTAEKLSQSVISQAPIVLLPRDTPKLYYKYSILVRQYALGKNEYAYWDALRKNTQNLGTLFDPQPTQLTGNVHNVSNPEEVVLGFVGAQSVAEKRLIIARNQLPFDWPYVTGYEHCVDIDTIPRPSEDPMDWPTPEEVLAFFKSGHPVALEELHFPALDPRPFYVFSSVDCVDCRTRGVKTKPAYW